MVALLGFNALAQRRSTRGRFAVDDAGGAAHALELLGERRALRVVREPLLGPKRFTDLRANS